MSQTKVEAPFVENNVPFRNKVINGDMSVAQRSTSVTGIGANGNAYHTLDRMEINAAGTTAGRLTMTQTADGPGVFGLTKCLKLACTTADTSIAAGEVLQIQHKIEGQFLQDFHKGTSDAKKMTVSFYVKGNASAKYTLNLFDADNTRMNGQTFDVTTSWTRVTLVYDADTTGAFDNDNAASLQMIFVLHGGTTYSGGTFAENTWASYANNLQIGDSTTSFFDSTNRTFFITGLQLEVGDQATDFEHLPTDIQFQRCQRYFYNHTDPKTSGNEPISMGSMYSSSQCNGMIAFPVSMRTSPSLVCSDASSHFRIYRNSGSDPVDNWSAGELTLNMGEIFNSSDVSGTAGHACTITTDDASASMTFNAEL